MMNDALATIRSNSSSDLDALVHMWNWAEYLACELACEPTEIWAFVANVASAKGLSLSWYV